MAYAGTEPGIQENLEEYFQYVILSNAYETITDPATIALVGNTFWWNQTRVPMTLCTEGRFKNMNSTTAQMGITDSFLCPADDFNFTLFGSYSA